MRNTRRTSRALSVGISVAALLAGCSFSGANSLPLPGTVGRGSDSQTFHVEIANVGTLESNSPVLIDDVVVGSVGELSVEQWHASVEISVEKGVEVPANAVATVGQTSLLGSMHLALNPPPGVVPEGVLASGSTIGLDDSSTYPSTEQTLASLSTLANGGGLGQIGDVLDNAALALDGRADEVREVLTRLNDVVGVLDGQSGNIVASINQLDSLSATLAGQRDVLDRALNRIPPALDVLIKQRPNITEALDRLGVFSTTLNGVVTDVHDDLITNLQNLAPLLRVLADVGPDLDTVLAYLTTYPLSQDIIDRGVRGDYMNLFAVIDLTVPRLKRTTLLGTRFGVPRHTLTPAPGDPWQLNYSYDPLGVPLMPPVDGPGPVAPIESTPVAEAAPGPPTAYNGPVMAVNPPVLMAPAVPGGPDAPIFSGPYPAESPSGRP